MKIGGLQNLTLIDYPEKLACTVFTSECNFRCPFCYSSELVLPEKIKNQPTIKEADFFNFLDDRKRLLDGVVVCGGEPTVHEELPRFIKKIKKMNYCVKLDTNGSNPQMLQKLISQNLVDYVAMDIKAPKDKYEKVAGKKISITNIEKSINCLKESKIDYEFRTTVTPGLLDKKDIVEISKWIGVSKKYYLQNFKPGKNVDPAMEQVKPYPSNYLLEIKQAVAPLFDVCEIRNA